MAPMAKDPPKAMLRAISLGAKSGSDSLHLAISLNFRDRAGMQSFVDAVSDPHGPIYRHYIGPDQVGARFGYSPSEVRRVADYLQAKGMHIRLLAKNRLAILADATVAQAEAAFNTSIESFWAPSTIGSDNGQRFSFTTSPQLPIGIVGDVLDISGLENFTRPKPALTPANIEGLYTVSSLYARGSQGQGRTVAISNWDGFRISNEVLQCQYFKLPVPSGGAGSNITIESVEGGDGYEEAEYGEGDLDIQGSIEMAPLCNLLIYDNDEPSGNADLVGVLTQEADDNTADVITESYGWYLDIPTAAAAHNQHLSMSAEGITYLTASGDSGTDLGYDYPDIDPDVLLIGGTTAIVNAENQRISEIGWNSDGGAGGGGWAPSTDAFNVRPPYQLTPTFLASSGVPGAAAVPYRLSPDVSFNADPNTGFYVFFPTGYEVFGGTSGASPTCAGGLAVAEQQLANDGFLQTDSNGHQRFGRIADLLYSYNENGGVFYDIVSGTNGSLPNGQVSEAVPGWDTDSGWGAIKFAGLVAMVENVPDIASLKLSASVITGGTPVTGTVSISISAPGAGVTVSLSSSGADLRVPASVTVAPGSTTATFEVKSNGVASEETLDVSASTSDGSEAAQIVLFPAQYSALTISPGTVAGGDRATGTIVLNGSAPPKGFPIALTSGSGLATVPTTVTVPANSGSVTFQITTSPVARGGTVTISGMASNTQTQTATLTVQAATVASVGLSTSSVVGASSTKVTGTITLDGPALKGGDTVTLKSSNTKLATVPASVRVAPGSYTATFAVNHLLVSEAGTTTVTATLNGAPQAAPLTVNPFQVAGFYVSPEDVNGGVVVKGYVTLNVDAGTKSGPIRVKLASSSASAVVPGAVTVPEGAGNASFTVKTPAVSAATTANITASLNGSSSTQTLTINPTILGSISASPGVVTSPATRVIGTVQLGGIAPAGGVAVSLRSSNPSAVTVPATVTVPAGKPTASFTVTHKRVSTPTVVTIAATLGATTVSTTITVNAG